MFHLLICSFTLKVNVRDRRKSSVLGIILLSTPDKGSLSEMYKLNKKRNLPRVWGKWTYIWGTSVRRGSVMSDVMLPQNLKNNEIKFCNAMSLTSLFCILCILNYKSKKPLLTYSWDYILCLLIFFHYSARIQTFLDALVVHNEQIII